MVLRPLIVVSAVIPGLVALTACCGRKSTSTTTYSGYERTVLVTADAFLAALDDQGGLDPAACGPLCEAQGTATYGYDTEVLSVDGCEPGATETTDTTGTTATTGTTTTGTTTPPGGSGGSGAAADTGAVEQVPVLCSLTVRQVNRCVGGRDHACVASPHDGSGPELVGAWLAAQAHAEATSVGAFRAIAAELAGFGAPAPLIASARAAARDEVAHARALRRLARARGGVPGPVSVGTAPPRSLVAFAVENAVEGCVHETWAAVVAAHQAAHAGDPGARAAFAVIAADEARHADLAWAIDHWLQGRLGPAERAQVEQARAAAVAALEGSLGEVEPALVAAVGLPTGEESRALARGLQAAVWGPAAAA